MIVDDCRREMAEAVDSTEVQQLSLIVDDCRREMAEAVDSTEVQQPAAAGRRGII